MSTPTNLLEISDEEFEKLMEPPPADAPSDETVEGAAEPAAPGSEVEATPEGAAAPAAEQPPVEKTPVLAPFLLVCCCTAPRSPSFFLLSKFQDRRDPSERPTVMMQLVMSRAVISLLTPPVIVMVRIV